MPSVVVCIGTLRRLRSVNAIVIGLNLSLIVMGRTGRLVAGARTIVTARIMKLTINVIHLFWIFIMKV